MKVDSWHIESVGDKTITLCGLEVRAHPEHEGQRQAQGWSFSLPLADPSCETCLRLFAAEEDSA